MPQLQQPQRRAAASCEGTSNVFSALIQGLAPLSRRPAMRALHTDEWHRAPDDWWPRDEVYAGTLTRTFVTEDVVNDCLLDCMQVVLTNLIVHVGDHPLHVCFGEVKCKAVQVQEVVDVGCPHRIEFCNEFCWHAFCHVMVVSIQALVEGIVREACLVDVAIKLRTLDDDLVCKKGVKVHGRFRERWEGHIVVALQPPQRPPQVPRQAGCQPCRGARIVRGYSTARRARILGPRVRHSQSAAVLIDDGRVLQAVRGHGPLKSASLVRLPLVLAPGSMTNAVGQPGQRVL
mmetsp:Transcript_48432/g.122192  ORF Transcript_48432/g.122192 Transcript_48432/m.122192 type:complete len:289 (-) Transcript_48432:262-1128(-)